MSFKEKLLNKSKSYNYYKKYYKLLKKSEEDLNNKITKLNSDLKSKNEIITNLQNKMDNYEHLIKVFEEKFEKEKKYFKDVNIAYVLAGFPIHSETFIISEVKWLKENGFNIFVFIRYESYKPINLDFNVENIRFNNEIELETFLIEYDIDLIHTHFVYPICTEYTFPVAERLKIPFTVFAHAYDIFVHENDEKNRIGEISQSQYCRAIFTLSEFHKNYLLDRNVDENKIVITKQATTYELIPINKKDNGIINIVSVSRFVEKKGLDILIDAAKLLEEGPFEFSIYGFGDLEESLQKQIYDLNLKNIIIKGELQPNEVKNVLINADLLVSPCKVANNGDMDGFPTIIFEAMAVGLPVLTTNVSAIPEIIKDGYNGFITEPENPEKFAKKIKEISSLPSDKLFKIRKQAQIDVKNSSSVEKTMRKYIEFI